MNPVWFCFAVKEEAAFVHLPQARILLTGMGESNTRHTLETAFREQTPSLVLTCGFAGGLNPNHPTGTVLCTTDPGSTRPIPGSLEAAGAIQGVFHHVEQVVSTREEKKRLREATGADAVEMESHVVCSLCRSRDIPCAIVRVISDSADENLPLDFNQVMTPDQRIDIGKLAWHILRHPSTLPGLMRLGRDTRRAARALGQVLGAWARINDA